MNGLKTEQKIRVSLKNKWHRVLINRFQVACIHKKGGHFLILFLPLLVFPLAVVVCSSPTTSNRTII